MTEALAKKNEIEARHGRRPYPNEGELWRHFKGGLYSIVATVQHTENKKWYIVYKAEKTFGKAVKGEVYLRPAVMFMSRTDKRKYPDAEQEYRFEKVEVSEDGHVE